MQEFDTLGYMRHFRGIIIIGIIEILIGSITLSFNFASVLLSTNTKAPNVLIFVIIASCISTLLGIGILKLKKQAYQLLLYFASVVLLSKLLILANIIQLNGALETTVPASLKNLISILYHCFIIYYLNKGEIKKIFHR